MFQKMKSDNLSVCRTWTAFLLLCLLPCLSFAQGEICGTVRESLTSAPVPGAVIRIRNSFLFAVTGPDGIFRIHGLHNNSATLEISHIGFEEVELTISVPDTTLNIRLTPRVYLSEEITVTALRTPERSPFAYTTIRPEELNNLNLGQDIPELLNNQPSVVTTSDAGNGVGYSALRIRGSDATRINVTLNGIPVNDAESHQVYWVDIPDLASSVDNIQIQRGLGTSTNGAGALGGSINILTGSFRQEPSGEISSSFGSFNTRKNTVRFSTGLLNKKFSMEGRISSIHSDGYIDRATSSLQSISLSGGYAGKKDILRAILLKGHEKTYQAWYGVPQDSLESNRTFNPAGMYRDSLGNLRYYENQTDNYSQDYYQLFYSHAFSHYCNLNLGLFLTRGKGYYEEYRENDDVKDYGLMDFISGTDTIRITDLIRQRWLDNYFYGFTWSFNYERSGFSIHSGGLLNRYDGEHYNDLLWARDLPVPLPPFRYNSDQAKKYDASIFTKIQFSLSDYFAVFADLQVRTIGYHFTGFDLPGEQVPQQVTHTFFNPKAGINWSLSNHSSVYFSVGRGGKEPVRDDYVNSSPTSRPNPEELTDLETGFRHQENKWKADLNLYYMDYTDQLILTGAVNDVGEYTRQNVKHSYRSGIELEGFWQPIPAWNFTGNITISSNKIKAYHEFIDDYDNSIQLEKLYSNTDIAFSPSLTGAYTLQWNPVKELALMISGKYTGRQFLDNTSSLSKSLPAYYIQDFRVVCTLHPRPFREVVVNAVLKNLFNETYSSNGYTYGYVSSGRMETFNYYYPQAGIHFMAGVTLGF